jgi:hypothetical protein
MNLPNLLARLTDATPLRVVCAWCPDFDANAPQEAGITHGMCPSCAAKADAEITAFFATKESK